MRLAGAERPAGELTTDADVELALPVPEGLSAEANGGLAVRTEPVDVSAVATGDCALWHPCVSGPPADPGLLPDPLSLDSSHDVEPVRPWMG